MLVRVDGAGGIHELLAWLTRRRLAYSVGFSLPGDVASIQAKLATIPADLWEPASDADGQLRPGAWVADRVIKADPTAGAALPRRRKAAAAMTIPTAGEVGAALDLAPDWFQPFVAVCAFAGLRLGEAAGLRLEDVDFLRRTISVRHQVQGETNATVELAAPKPGSERVVYVPGELIGLLSEHVGRAGIESGDWLVSSDGRPLRQTAGLAEYTLHDLRHFYASGLIAAGCDVATVQRALGHSSATITLGVYAPLWPSAEDRTRAAAGGLMAAALGARADWVRTSRS